jgi:hypothetical protein
MEYPIVFTFRTKARPFFNRTWLHIGLALAWLSHGES